MNKIVEFSLILFLAVSFVLLVYSTYIDKEMNFLTEFFIALQGSKENLVSFIAKFLYRFLHFST